VEASCLAYSKNIAIVPTDAVLACKTVPEQYNFSHSELEKKIPVKTNRTNRLYAARGEYHA
jgi:hypothetical protein